MSRHTDSILGRIDIPVRFKHHEGSDYSILGRHILCNKCHSRIAPDDSKILLSRQCNRCINEQPIHFEREPEIQVERNWIPLKQTTTRIKRESKPDGLMSFLDSLIGD